MQDDEIKNYLKNHPEFFEQNASLLAEIHLPSPHGSGTISLAERQQLAQRDKINALEERFAVHFVLIFLFAFVQIGAATHEISHAADITNCLLYTSRCV